MTTCKRRIYCDGSGKGTFVSTQNQDFIREENRRRIEQLLTDAVELAKENGIELEELRTTVEVLYQEEDV